MDLVRIEAKQLVRDHLAQNAQPDPAGVPDRRGRPLVAARLSAAA